MERMRKRLTQRVLGKHIPVWLVALLIAGTVAASGVLLSNVLQTSTQVTGVALSLSGTMPPQAVDTSGEFTVTVTNNRPITQSYHLTFHIGWDQTALIACGDVDLTLAHPGGNFFPISCDGPIQFDGPDGETHTALVFHPGLGAEFQFTVDPRATVVHTYEVTYHLLATYDWFVQAESS